MEKKSYIYIIGNGEDYKLGVSIKPAKRIKQLQTGSASNLEIVETYELPKNMVYRLEKECHQALSSYYAKRGEWFSKPNLWHMKIIVEEVCEEYLDN